LSKEVEVEVEVEHKPKQEVTLLEKLEVQPKEDVQDYIKAIGGKEIKELKVLSTMLNSPISSMALPDSSQNVIGEHLTNMKNEVQGIAPNNFNLDPNPIVAIWQKITGSSAVQNYVTKFQTTGDVIKSIDNKLESGSMLLQEDNINFKEDRKRYKGIISILKDKVENMLLADEQVNTKIESTTDEDKKKFLQTEIAFPLKQQIMDLQQIMVVTQQGETALNILIKNNEELIKSVARVQTVTLTALNIGATIAIGLANQKRVLETTQNINTMTDDILSSNASLLKEQGASIAKQASSTMLNIDKLQKTIQDSLDALEEAERYKVNSLEGMDRSINLLNSMNSEVDIKLNNIAQGEKLRLAE